MFVCPTCSIENVPTCAYILHLLRPASFNAWTRVLLTRYTLHGTCGKTWCTILKTKGQSVLQRPQSASFTHNMTIVHLKAQVSDSTRSTQEDRSKKATPKSAVRRFTGPPPGVAWTGALLGHKATMVAPLSNHSGTFATVRHVSMRRSHDTHSPISPARLRWAPSHIVREFLRALLGFRAEPGH